MKPRSIMKEYKQIDPRYVLYQEPEPEPLPEKGGELTRAGGLVFVACIIFLSLTF